MLKKIVVFAAILGFLLSSSLSFAEEKQGIFKKVTTKAASLLTDPLSIRSIMKGQEKSAALSVKAKAKPAALSPAPAPTAVC